MQRRQSARRMAESLTDLPPNILTEILSRLPLKSLCAARCTCTAFLNLTTPPNPHFARLHSTNAAQTLLLQFGANYAGKPSTRLRLIEPELDLAFHNFKPMPLFQLPYFLRNSTSNFFLANSCNGLIYLVRKQTRDEGSLVCNPVTNEYVVIPDVDRRSRSGSTLGMWLGFSPGSGQYKVLRKFAHATDVRVRAQVLVVGSDSWRDVVGHEPMLVGPGHWWETCATFLNGRIYWPDELLKRIGFFDFDREVFGGISFPSEFGAEQLGNVSSMGTGVIGGCLCVTYSDYNARHVEFWVMKQPSWRKEFVIDIVESMGCRLAFSKFMPLQVLKNGEILMLWLRNCLVCYDPRTKRVRFLGSSWLRLNPRAVAFTPSFIPLKDTLGVDKVMVQYVRPRGDEKEL